MHEDMTPDTINEYAKALKAGGEALIPFATLAILIWKAGLIKKRRKAARKVSEPINYREGIAWIIYLVGAGLYFYAVYLGWGHPSVAAWKWHLITIAVFMLSIVVNSAPIAKPDVLLLTSLVLVVVLEITQITFMVLKEVVSHPGTAAKSSP